MEELNKYISVFELFKVNEIYPDAKTYLINYFNIYKTNEFIKEILGNMKLKDVKQVELICKELIKFHLKMKKLCGDDNNSKERIQFVLYLIKVSMGVVDKEMECYYHEKELFYLTKSYIYKIRFYKYVKNKLREFLEWRDDNSSLIIIDMRKVLNKKLEELREKHLFDNSTIDDYECLIKDIDKSI